MACHQAKIKVVKQTVVYIPSIVVSVAAFGLLYTLPHGPSVVCSNSIRAIYSFMKFMWKNLKVFSLQ